MTPVVLLAGLAALAGMLAATSRNLLIQAATRSMVRGAVTHPQVTATLPLAAAPVVELRARPRELFAPPAQDLVAVTGAELALSRAA